MIVIISANIGALPRSVSNGQGTLAHTLYCKTMMVKAVICSIVSDLLYP